MDDWEEEEQISTRATWTDYVDRSGRRDGRYGGGCRRGGTRGRPPNEGERSTVKVAANHVGKLIGRAGVQIKELRQKSGTKIEIGEEEDREAEVHVYGSQEQRDEAKRLIYEVLGYDKGYATTSSSSTSREDELIDWDAIKTNYEVAQKAKWAKCPPLIKDFYEEHPDVTNMPKEEVAQFRKENNNIVVSNFDENSDAPLLNPCPQFHHSFWRFPDILKTIEKQGFEKPSPIQAQAWPYLLSGKDMIGIAQTGTGKTLAFLMPSFIHIDQQPLARGERGGPNVLVLSPTRELALQIEEEVRKYEYKGIKSVCVYGGGDRRQQMRVVTAGVEVIIATPGRLNDLVEAGVVAVGSITYLVLDEADRMLDMGFEPQVYTSSLVISSVISMLFLALILLRFARSCWTFVQIVRP